MEDHENGDAQETLAALLRDLAALERYLSERGRHTHDLAQRFLENARRDPSNRAYDERQAAMLDYQHYIWHEIAGMVNKLLVTYGPDESHEAGVDGERDTPPEGAR
ncbi:MAG: hypothetical protein ACRDHE_07715 [Ktedonobacterales bacterium]